MRKGSFVQGSRSQAAASRTFRKSLQRPRQTDEELMQWESRHPWAYAVPQLNIGRVETADILVWWSPSGLAWVVFDEQVGRPVIAQMYYSAWTGVQKVLGAIAARKEVK